MRKPTRHSFRKLFRRYNITIVIILFAILATAGILYWGISTAEAKIAITKHDAATQSADVDAKIKAIQAQKVAELQASQAAIAQSTESHTQTTSNPTISSADTASCNQSTSHNNPASIDVVVNKKHCIQPVTFVPGDLVSIGNGYVLSQKAAPSFTTMMTAANAAGISLAVTSSYRSYSTQVSTYAYWVNTSGKVAADTYSARPGYSEHQTGLAFDISSNGCILNCFGSSAAYSWMQANTAKYGFIQRYYKGEESITGYEAEEWHYRYVGVAVAEAMQAQSVKTLEQYWGISGGESY